MSDTIPFVQKIEAILIAGGVARSLAANNIPMDMVVASIEARITLGKSKGESFDVTRLFSGIQNDIIRQLGDTAEIRRKLNTTIMAVVKTLRNNKTISTYSDLEREILQTYQKTTDAFTNVNVKEDSDVSDMFNPANVVEIERSSDRVPEIDPTFQKWGDYHLIADVIAGRQFMPIMIVGLSGNGKSVQVEQACANLNREYYRLQITPETDEADMIGGMRLVNGDTVFEYGPVIRAMKEGAILCIDEIDRGSNRLMALQGVMEGKPVMIKKTGEIVTPAPGFNVIATANTKGQGDETGKFSAATILDEAFLERFVMVIEQDFAPADVERSILAAHMVKFGVTPSRKIINELIRWAAATRENFARATSDEYISTRRLCHILQIFSVVKNIETAVERGVARYDASTKESLINAFKLI